MTLSSTGTKGGYAIGIDLGTQSLKGRLLAPDGRMVAEAQASYRVDYPRPGWAEQAPADWWQASVAVVRTLVESHGLAASDVATLALASQVDGAVVVDRDGSVLHPAIIWLDRRAADEAAWLRRQLPPSGFLQRSGLNVDPSHVAPKLLWLREQRPELFERAVTYHVPGSWALARLTGASVVDHSNASSTLLYDVRTRRWSEELLSAAGLDAERLPAVADATAAAGELTADAAEQLGLSSRCVVAVGCGDEHAAALGAGVLTAGPVCDIAGTAEPVAVAAAAPAFDETGLVETHAHADPRSWLIENPGFVSGGSVAWFNETIARTTYASLTRLAADVPPGSDGVTFLPALSGAMTPRWNGDVRGVFLGLSMATGVGHLARAVFEGCAFGVRDIVDRFEALGLGDGEIRVVGGGSKSDLLLQMKSDVTGRAVRSLADPEATATGAAMIAGVLAGTFASLDEAAAALTTFDPRQYEPDPSTVAAYEDAYRAYRALYDAVEPLFGSSVDG